MNRAKRVCNAPGCHELTYNSYCDKHKRESVKYKNNKYDKLNRNKKAKEFYNSSEWNRAKFKRLKQDLGLCVKCREKGIFVNADVVHHITELLVDWDKRLDNNNLISLCHSCHNNIHKHIG